MAFERQQNIIITGVEDVAINFLVPGPSAPDSTNIGTIEIQLSQSNGKIKQAPPADLIARLGDDAEGITHLSNLLLLRDYLQARILAEVLPTP